MMQLGEDSIVDRMRGHLEPEACHYLGSTDQFLMIASAAVSLKRIADVMGKPIISGEPERPALGSHWNEDALFERLKGLGVIKPRVERPFSCPTPRRDEHVTNYIQRCTVAFEEWVNSHVQVHQETEA